MPTIYMAVAIAGMLNLSGCSLIKVKEPEQIEVADVVKKVSEALEEIGAKRPSLYKNFDSAEIALETVTETETSGEIKLLVISVNSSVTNAMAQTIYYKLKLPTTKALANGEKMTIEGKLAKAIVKASEEIDSALASQKHLELKELSGTVKFEVKRSGGGGPEVELAPVTLGAGHSTSRGVSHAITLNFSVPDKP